jgi:hypothetical protein
MGGLKATLLWRLMVATYKASKLWRKLPTRDDIKSGHFCFFVYTCKRTCTVCRIRQHCKWIWFWGDTFSVLLMLRPAKSTASSRSHFANIRDLWNLINSNLVSIEMWPFLGISRGLGNVFMLLSMQKVDNYEVFFFVLHHNDDAKRSVEHT